jgi:hypothetical protein
VTNLMMFFGVKTSYGPVGIGQRFGERAASIFRADAERNFSPEDGYSTLLRNVGLYQPVHMVT